MKTSKTRTSNRTIQSFSWSRPQYSVRWAYKPGDVPEYDPARGANPYALHSSDALTYDDVIADLKRRLITLNKRRNVTSASADRKILLRSIDKLECFLAETNPEHELDGLKGVALLKGDKAPPPSRTVYEYPLHVEEGRPSPYMTEVANYPRLVRASVEPQQELRGDTKSLKRLACMSIADLHNETDDKQFKKRILEVAESFSPLDPFDIHADTLEGWRHTAAEMHFLVRLLKKDNELKADSKEEADKDSYVQRLCEWFEEQEKDNPFATAFMRSLDMFAPYYSEKNREAERERGVAVLFARFEDSFDEKECRQVISAILWRRFATRANRLSPMYIDPMEHLRLGVACGALGWAYLELWDAFSHKHIKQCVTCHRLFIATSKKAKACPTRWSCQKAVSRQK